MRTMRGCNVADAISTVFQIKNHKCVTHIPDCYICTTVMINTRLYCSIPVDALRKSYYLVLRTALQFER
ncbi:hypothetical protein POVCU1_004560 [Plasmodium ovale curtisi]|uniref:Uncharacterized protein n=1 Tax=Plasmodium ovale curtisi TaxID=864141 RepID=A0A1A8VLA4_PLAOA|nr:hypothetical protein POVCU1_004560 [Plasmodium ovale curtisi]